MTGAEFSTAVEEINGGDPIGSTLRFQFGNLGKNLIEQRRPWMILRKTDTSKTIATSNTWQTAIDPSTITDFSRFYQTPSDPYRFGFSMARIKSPNTAWCFSSSVLSIRSRRTRRFTIIQ